MTNRFYDFALDESFLRDESIQETFIELLPEHLSQATRLSEAVLYTKRRWQTYLNLLALQAFRQWLEEWAPELLVDDADCSILQPQYVNLIDAVSNLRVGAFTVCLVTVDDPADEVIELPRAVVDLPQFTPHCYVLVNLLEEQAQAEICGYLRHDQLLHRQSIQPLRASSAWTFEVPLAWFTLDANALLLDLRYLDAAAIPLAASAPSPVSLPHLKAKLAELQDQIRSPIRLPEELLTWEEGATLLGHPNLISTYLLDPALNPPQLQRIAQQAINTGLWLQDQLDSLAQDLSWMLMPATLAFRAQAQAFETVRTELEKQEIAIPPSARGAYQDLVYESLRLRLYVLVWPLAVVDTAPEWTLLLSLGAEAEMQMPAGVGLQVQDDSQVLAERVSTGTPDDAFLCIQVAGTWDEQFRVIVILPDSAVINLPPFVFNPTEPS